MQHNLKIFWCFWHLLSTKKQHWLLSFWDCSVNSYSNYPVLYKHVFYSIVFLFFLRMSASIEKWKHRPQRCQQKWHDWLQNWPLRRLKLRESWMRYHKPRVGTNYPIDIFFILTFFEFHTAYIPILLFLYIRMYCNDSNFVNGHCYWLILIDIDASKLVCW